MATSRNPIDDLLNVGSSTSSADFALKVNAVEEKERADQVKEMLAEARQSNRLAYSIASQQMRQQQALQRQQQREQQRVAGVKKVDDIPEAVFANIPSFDQSRYKIEGYDELPYSSKKELFNRYTEDNAALLASYFTNLDKDTILGRVLETKSEGAPVEPSRSLIEYPIDTVLGLGVGARRTGAAAARLLGFDETADNWGKVADQMLTLESDKSKNERLELQKQLAEMGPDASWIDETWTKLKGMNVTDVGSLGFDFATIAIPATKVSQGLTAMAKFAGLGQRAVTAAQAGGVAAANLAPSAIAANEALNRLRNASQEDLMQFDEYRLALEATNGDDAAARQAIENDVYWNTFNTSYLFGVATGALPLATNRLPTSLESILVGAGGRSQAGASVGARIAQSPLTGIGYDAVTNSAQQYLENIAGLNPNPSEDVGLAGVLGGVMSGVARAPGIFNSSGEGGISLGRRRTSVATQEDAQFQAQQREASSVFEEANQAGAQEATPVRTDEMPRTQIREDGVESSTPESANFRRAQEIAEQVDAENATNRQEIEPVPDEGTLTLGSDDAAITDAADQHATENIDAETPAVKTPVVDTSVASIDDVITRAAEQRVNPEATTDALVESVNTLRDTVAEVDDSITSLTRLRGIKTAEALIEAADALPRRAQNALNLDDIHLEARADAQSTASVKKAQRALDRAVQKAEGLEGLELNAAQRNIENLQSKLQSAINTETQAVVADRVRSAVNSALKEVRRGRTRLNKELNETQAVVEARPEADTAVQEGDNPAPQQAQTSEPIVPDNVTPRSDVADVQSNLFNVDGTYKTQSGQDALIEARQALTERGLPVDVKAFDRVVESFSAVGKTMPEVKTIPLKDMESRGEGVVAAYDIDRNLIYVTDRSTPADLLHEMGHALTVEGVNRLNEMASETSAKAVRAKAILSTGEKIASELNKHLVNTGHEAIDVNNVVEMLAEWHTTGSPDALFDFKLDLRAFTKEERAVINNLTKVESATRALLHKGLNAIGLRNTDFTNAKSVIDNYVQEVYAQTKSVMDANAEVNEVFRRRSADSIDDSLNSEPPSEAETAVGDNGMDLQNLQEPSPWLSKAKELFVDYREPLFKRLNPIRQLNPELFDGFRNAVNQMSDKIYNYQHSMLSKQEWNDTVTKVQALARDLQLDPQRVWNDVGFAITAKSFRSKMSTLTNGLDAELGRLIGLRDAEAAKEGGGKKSVIDGFDKNIAELQRTYRNVVADAMREGQVDRSTLSTPGRFTYSMADIARQTLEARYGEDRLVDIEKSFMEFHATKLLDDFLVGLDSNMDNIAGSVVKAKANGQIVDLTTNAEFARIKEILGELLSIKEQNGGGFKAFTDPELETQFKQKYSQAAHMLESDYAPYRANRELNFTDNINPADIVSIHRRLGGGEETIDALTATTSAINRDSSMFGKRPVVDQLTRIYDYIYEKADNAEGKSEYVRPDLITKIKLHSTTIPTVIARNEDPYASGGIIDVRTGRKYSFDDKGLNALLGNDFTAAGAFTQAKQLAQFFMLRANPMYVLKSAFRSPVATWFDVIDFAASEGVQLPKGMFGTYARHAYTGVDFKFNSGGAEARKWAAEYNNFGGDVVGQVHSRFLEMGGRSAEEMATRYKDTPNGRKNALRDWRNTINYYGGQFETNAKVAMFRTLVESGVPRQQAALLTRNSMDFSKRGAITKSKYGQQFFFLQAIFTGGDRLVRSFVRVDRNGNYSLNKRGVRNMGLKLGFMTAMVAAGRATMTDQEYDAIPDWKRNSYVNFKVGSQMVSLPMPYGSVMFAGVFGSNAVEAIEGEKTFTRAAWDGAINNVQQNFMPGDFVDLGQIFDDNSGKTKGEIFFANSVRMFTPDLFKPVVDVGFNLNQFGGLIKRDNQFASDTGYGTDVKRTQDVTMENEYVYAAKSLNELFGADIFSAAQIRHLVKGYSFGILKFGPSYMSAENAKALGRDSEEFKRTQSAYFRLQDRAEKIVQDLAKKKANDRTYVPTARERAVVRAMEVNRDNMVTIPRKGQSREQQREFIARNSDRFLRSYSQGYERLQQALAQ